MSALKVFAPLSRNMTTVAVGDRFGRLTVLEHSPNPHRPKKPGQFWRCKCDCGTELRLNSADLKARRTCGFKCRLRKQNYTEAKYRQHLRNAASRGLPALDFDTYWFLCQQPCFYCGAPPSNSPSDKKFHGHVPISTIDRIDSRLGYIPTNVVPACWPCNRFKTDDPVLDFVRHLERFVASAETFKEKLLSEDVDWSTMYGALPIRLLGGRPKFEAGLMPFLDIPDEG